MASLKAGRRVIRNRENAAIDRRVLKTEEEKNLLCEELSAEEEVEIHHVNLIYWRFSFSFRRKTAPATTAFIKNLET